MLPLLTMDHSKEKCACVLSRFNYVWLFATPWTVAHQAPLSRGFSRQEYQSRLPCPPPEVFPTQGLNPCLSCLLHWRTSSLSSVPPGKPKREDRHLKSMGNWQEISCVNIILSHDFSGRHGAPHCGRYTPTVEMFSDHWRMVTNVPETVGRH